MRIAAGGVCVLLAVTGCGGGSASQWKSLRRVTVTVAQPGLPPPYGKPKVVSFTTPVEVRRVTALLNAHRIASNSAGSSGSACSGGFQIAITITPQHGAPVQLSAYRCDNQTTGDVSGDLVGFLGAIGFSV